ncbi:hypothetical protein GCM10011390_30160 [Aureimonas endophytica]|uniref:Lipoprotein with Yx(FWY)xxD motif n=1 Tax=Aureimonas endophytica TaxID=2027858 RepID=A0A917E7R1_9HYPH|nr:hypothetical protein [Aureimonas endophytica]GGE09042.1 hypothetical protein GCM10011390_30160 [Aureimonas endophytica]
MKMRVLILAGLAGALAAPLALAEDYAGGAVTTTKTKAGEILADAKGMTLYTFDKDKKGQSACYDDCAAKWPPLLATGKAAAKDGFTLVERKGGEKQWAYKGMPLYLWQNDKKPGDTTGDGVGGVWHVATE